MQNPMQSFDAFTRHCAFYGIINPFTRLQWHVTIKYLDEKAAYNIACDVLNGFRYTEAVSAYLSGADLSGADLRGADLSGADLRGANVKESNNESV